MQISEASHAEGFVLFREDLSSRGVRLWKLKYSSSEPKTDLPEPKVILRLRWFPPDRTTLLILDIRDVTPTRPSSNCDDEGCDSEAVLTATPNYP